jgi:circadian clock protein KaiB
MTSDDDGRDPETLLLRLYITSEDGAFADAARDGLERLVSMLRIETRVEVIDIGQEPARAEDDHVIATPTLERVEPTPVLRVIGDLADLDAAMNGLGLRTWKLDPGGDGS